MAHYGIVHDNQGWDCLLTACHLRAGEAGLLLGTGRQGHARQAKKPDRRVVPRPASPARPGGSPHGVHRFGPPSTPSRAKPAQPGIPPGVSPVRGAAPGAQSPLLSLAAPPARGTRLAAGDHADEGAAMPIWAYLYEHPGCDPDEDRTVLDRGGQRTLLVPVSAAADAPAVAQRLVDQDGAALIELCGGFSLSAAAEVTAAVGDRAAVGHVTFAADAVPLTASYIAAAVPPPPR